MKRLVRNTVLVIVLCLLAGCIAPAAQRTYSVNDTRVLYLNLVETPSTMTLIEKSGNHTTSPVIFHTPSGDVYAIYATPDNPDAASYSHPERG